MTDAAADRRHMAEALRLARRGLYTTDPNPRVGCVIVRDGVVVGHGWHERAGGPHAEIRALRAAGDRARRATVYLSFEPCCHHGKTPPCTEALIAAGVARVVAAMQDPNPHVAGQGFAALTRRGIAVESGLMQAEAEQLNPGFVRRLANGRPYVRLKLGASLDGRTAAPDGGSRWITSEAARADVQRWRARSSAVLTGIGTVLADDPSLDVRGFDIGRQPLRVVLDSTLRLSPAAKLLTRPGRTLVVAATSTPGRLKALQRAGAEVLVLDSGGRVDLVALLDALATRELNEILVEAGPTLSGALLEDGLVDEVVLYFAPSLLGDGARGMFRLPRLTHLEDRVQLEIRDVRAVGRDWRVLAHVMPATGTE